MYRNLVTFGKSHFRSQKSRYEDVCTTSTALLVIVTCFIFVIFPQPSNAQSNLLQCDYTATTESVTVDFEIIFKNPEGEEICNCEPGSSAFLRTHFMGPNGAGQTRRNIHMLAHVKVGNTYLPNQDFCLLGAIGDQCTACTSCVQGPTPLIYDIPIPGYQCGDAISVEQPIYEMSGSGPPGKVLFTWETAASAPCDCGFYGCDPVGQSGQKDEEVVYPYACNIECSPPSCTACQGESITLTAQVTGGTPGFTYSWKDPENTEISTQQTVTVTEGGIYTLNVTDSVPCTTTCTKELIFNPNPQVVVDDVEVCEGETATLNAVASGCNVATYQWYVGEDPQTGTLIPGAEQQSYSTSTPGIYSVLVTCASGCTGYDSASVTINIRPTVEVDDVEICEGETATLSAVASGCTVTSYQWYMGEDPQTGTLIPGAEQQSYSTSTPGIYSVLVTCASGCTGYDSATVTVKPCKPFLEVNKTAMVTEAEEGDTVTYTIEICNTGTITVNDILVKDVFDRNVIVISSYPAPTGDNVWHIEYLEPGDCAVITVEALVPRIETKFDMLQQVSGRGFVNIYKDYDTSKEAYTLRNCAYVTAEGVGSVSDCAYVTVVEELGTELNRRQHGSGEYVSQELSRIRTENKSIESNTSLSATYSPTNFVLPLNRSLNYTTLWTEKARTKNKFTGASINEEYTFLKQIDRESSFKLDENGSTMAMATDFQGMGHIGLLKIAPPDDPPKFGQASTFESQEDYVGSFRVEEMFDEYGSNVKYQKYGSGQGYVSSDQRVRDTQRTYEYGTGSYESEELIDTPTSYIAKDINLTHAPTSYVYTPDVESSPSIKWYEGIWSKSDGSTLKGGDLLYSNSSSLRSGRLARTSSYIGEEYSALDYMKKETEARGLNEMNTEASFSGTADLRNIVHGGNGTAIVDTDERYVGQYELKRRVMVTGVSKYDTPHLTIIKEGDIFQTRFNRTDGVTLARYSISVTNDGNRALAPIYVRDIFPAGAVFINSTVRPTELTAKHAAWTLTHLAIGDTVSIGLLLNVTSSKNANLVNRAEASGGWGDGNWTVAGNYSALERDWAPCCQPYVTIDKTAELYDVDPSQVVYRIVVTNHGNDSLSATITDHLPYGLSYVSSAITPSSNELSRVQWVIPELVAGNSVEIVYLARAERNGGYTNTAQLDAVSLDGSGSYTSDSTAYINIGSTGSGPMLAGYGHWQPPEEWNLSASQEGLRL